MPNMTYIKEAACKLAKSIIALHAEVRSYRKIAERYPGVTFQTIGRIAKSGGAWIPKDRKVLRALGLIEPRKKADEHTKRIRREINYMVRETKKAVLK